MDFGNICAKRSPNYNFCEDNLIHIDIHCFYTIRMKMYQCSGHHLLLIKENLRKPLTRVDLKLSFDTVSCLLLCSESRQWSFLIFWDSFVHSQKAWSRFVPPRVQETASISLSGHSLHAQHCSSSCVTEWKAIKKNKYILLFFFWNQFFFIYA